MNVKQNEVERALERDTDVRLILLHGSDESGSRELGAKAVKPLGDDAERIDISAAQLRADPALLADEAAAFAMFGGRRWIRIDPAGDEILAAVEALLDAPAAGNPVVAIAGTLRKDSKLLVRAQADPRALACASYAPEGQQADKLAIAMARDAGLRVAPDVAHRLAEASGNDRAVLAREIEKFALFLDAAPDRPAELDHRAIDALGADAEDGDFGRLTAAVLDGKLDALDAELSRLAARGIEGIALIRGMIRRFHLMAQLAGEVAAGNAIDTVMASSSKSIFWKEKPEVTRQLRHWRTDAFATAIERLAEAERREKTSGTAGAVATAETIVAIGRAAQRMR